MLDDSANLKTVRAGRLRGAYLVEREQRDGMRAMLLWRQTAGASSTPMTSSEGDFKVQQSCEGFPSNSLDGIGDAHSQFLGGTRLHLCELRPQLQY